MLCPLVLSYSFGQTSMENNLIDSEDVQSKNNYPCIIRVGVSLSAFYNMENSDNVGYRIGLLYNLYIWEKSDIYAHFVISYHNSYVKGLNGIFYDIDDIKKTTYDLDFAALFTELHIPYEYQIYRSNDFLFKLGIGPFVFIGIKDYSKIKNLKITDTVIDNYSDYGKPLDDSYQGFLKENSGLGLSISVISIFQRFSIALSYSHYHRTIKNIDYLNSVSMNVGYSL